MEKAKILIVEDEAIIAMEIESQLQSLGYEITSIVNTGEKAIKKAEEDKPDIILMDIRVKGKMDGIDAAEIIRNQFGTPVVFSTAYLDEERIERAKITMPFGYVLKPIQEMDLKVTIEMALYVSKVDKERRQVEESLRKSQALLQKAEKVACLGTWKLKPSTREVQCSDELYRILGIQRKDGQNTTFLKNSVDAIHPDDLERVTKLSETAIADKKSYQVEYRVVHPDGNERNVMTKGEIARNDAGEIDDIIGVVQDITERKQSEESLRVSEERYRGIVEDTPALICRFNPGGIIAFVNSSYCTYFKKTYDELVGESFFSLIPEADRESVKSGLSSLKVSIPILSLEHKVILPNGKIGWQRWTNRAFFDSQGQIISYQSIGEDITERKQAEVALKKSEKKFQDIALCSGDWIWEMDKNSEYTFVSEKVRDVLGYNPDEIIGKTPFDLMPVEEVVRISKFFKEISSEKKPIVDFENWNLTKDGKKVCLLTNGVPILDDEGNYLGYRGVDKDITAFKNNEKEI
jgi:PAS domain S-box-containing protein